MSHDTGIIGSLHVLEFLVRESSLLAQMMALFTLELKQTSTSQSGKKKSFEVMVNPQSPITPHLYPEAIQLKLYQAFIFSIPILFSIILFLLFYLFYLKRRASSLSPLILPVSSIQQPASQLPADCLLDVKVELKDKLHVVVFNEELGTRDSLCCVCLGEFELKEELVEIRSCKHIFHLDCIHLWLYSHNTCPLCRSSVSISSSTKTSVDDNNDHPHYPETSPV